MKDGFSCFECGWNEGDLMYFCGRVDGWMKCIMRRISGIKFWEKMVVQWNFGRTKRRARIALDCSFWSNLLERTTSRGSLARANPPRELSAHANPSQKLAGLSEPLVCSSQPSVRRGAVLGTWKWCFNVWELFVWSPNARVRPRKW